MTDELLRTVEAITKAITDLAELCKANTEAIQELQEKIRCLERLESERQLQ